MRGGQQCSRSLDVPPQLLYARFTLVVQPESIIICIKALHIQPFLIISFSASTRQPTPLFLCPAKLGALGTYIQACTILSSFHAREWGSPPVCAGNQGMPSDRNPFLHHRRELKLALILAHVYAWCMLLVCRRTMKVFIYI